MAVTRIARHVAWRLTKQREGASISCGVVGRSALSRDQHANHNQRQPDKAGAKSGGVNGDQKLHPVFGCLAFGSVFFEPQRQEHCIAKADKAKHGQNHARVNHICKDIFHAGYVGVADRIGKLGLAPMHAWR